MSFSEYAGSILEEHMRQLYDSRNELFDNSNESYVRLERLRDLVNRFIVTWRDTYVQGLIDDQGEVPETVPVCALKGVAHPSFRSRPQTLRYQAWLSQGLSLEGYALA
jgi:hypothetical protein